MAGPSRPTQTLTLAGGPGVAGRRSPGGSWPGLHAGATAGVRDGDVVIARHHELHQHVQSCGDDRRRPAGPQRGRARAHHAAARQDQPGAGLAGGGGLPGAVRAPAPPREARLRHRGVRLHHLCRWLRAAGCAGGGRRRRNTTCRWRRCSRGTGTSRAASIRSAGWATWPRRLSSWRTPSPGPSTSTCRPSRSPSTQAGRRCCWPISGPTRRRSAPRPGGLWPPSCSPPAPSDIFSGDPRWRSPLAEPVGAALLGPGLHLHHRAAVLRPGPRRASAGLRHPRRPLPAAARRRHHDRPHLARRDDRSRQPGRPPSPRTRRGAGAVQHPGRAARQPRGHGARHVRQSPAAQPSRRRPGGGLDGPPAQRRGHGDLRGRRALPQPGDASGGAGRRRLRRGLVA